MSVAVAVTSALPASPTPLLTYSNTLHRGDSSPQRIFPGNEGTVKRQQEHNLCGSSLLTSSDCWFATLGPHLLCYFIIHRNYLGSHTELLCTELRSFVLAFTTLMHSPPLFPPIFTSLVNTVEVQEGSYGWNYNSRGQWPTFRHCCCICVMPVEQATARW